MARGQGLADDVARDDASKVYASVNLSGLNSFLIRKLTISNVSCRGHREAWPAQDERTVMVCTPKVSTSIHCLSIANGKVAQPPGKVYSRVSNGCLKTSKARVHRDIQYLLP